MKGDTLRIATTELECRALLYLSSMEQEACPLSKTQLKEYLHAIGGLEAIVQVAQTVSSGESIANRLIRLGWMTSSGEEVHMTDLGRAVLRAEQKAERESSPMEIILDARDPFAYVKVLKRIAWRQEPMLVDPFAGIDEYADIARHTSVDRLLTRPDRGDRRGLALAVEKLPDGRRLEVRVTDGIHDRFCISRLGSIDMLGTSLNGVGKGRVSVLVSIQPPFADEIRTKHERLWSEATPLDRAPTPTN